MTEWKHHYTGIDLCEKRWGKLDLYLQRDSHDKRLRFARLSIPRHMVGVFIGRGNYVKGVGGWELFTSNHHIGWSKPILREQFCRVEYSGSNMDPYNSFTVRLGGFGCGARSPKWLIARKRRQWEKEMEAYEAFFPEQPIE